MNQQTALIIREAINIEVQKIMYEYDLLLPFIYGGHSFPAGNAKLTM